MRRCCLLLAVVAGTTVGFACASTPPKVASLSLSSTGSLTPAPGRAVSLSVRAVMDDGTSIDFTGSSVCTLDAKDPPGTLQGNIFTATKFGFTNVVCTFSGATGALGITVPAPLKISIKDIQKGVLPQGAEVLVDAVVFGLEQDGSYTNFWAQDPGALERREPLLGHGGRHSNAVADPKDCEQKVAAMLRCRMLRPFGTGGVCDAAINHQNGRDNLRHDYTFATAASTASRYLL